MRRLVVPGGLDDALQLFRAFGPGEGAAVGIVALKKAFEKILEILLRALHAVRQPLLAEDAEEALDEIHPRRVRGCVVKLNSWMAAKPATGSLIFVDV